MSLLPEAARRAKAREAHVKSWKTERADTVSGKFIHVSETRKRGAKYAPR